MAQRRSLMDLGVLTSKQSPLRLVANLRTYQHPTTGMSVTVHPIPSLAVDQYWQRVWYNQHDAFDLVLMEDGYFPLQPGAPKARRSALLRRAFPFIAYHVDVDPAAAAKYMTAHEPRDIVESHMSYKALASGAETPVDPRARRAVDKLNEVALQENAPKTVVLPWNVYHAVYFFWRLEQEGYLLTKTEEVHLVSQWDILKMAFVSSFFCAIIVFTAINLIYMLVMGV